MPRIRNGAVLAVLAVLSSVVIAAPSTALPPNADNAMIANLTGKADNGTALSATFRAAGITTDSAGGTVADGRLTGTLIDPAGPAQPVDQQVALPVIQAGGNGRCRHVDAELGPVDLTVGGIVVHVDPSHLPALQAGLCADAAAHPQ